MELTSLAVFISLHGAAAAHGTAMQHLREVTIHAANDASYSSAVGSTVTKKPQGKPLASSHWAWADSASSGQRPT